MSFIGGGGVGISEIKKLKRRGERTAPCGTPLRRLRDWLRVLPRLTRPCLPLKKQASQRLSWGLRGEEFILEMSSRVETVSKALERSRQRVKVRVGGCF